jgi:uncharacterized protein
VSDQVLAETESGAGTADKRRVDGIVVEFDVPARMRDGVTLRADVYHPAGEGRWPTLVLRTPYSKSSITENAWNGVSPVEAARLGFIVVIQDVRGRYTSEGEWEPLRHEGRDGADTITWAAGLPGSNGHVGTLGGSYCGATQWLAALEQPPALKAITPLLTWNEPMDGLVFRGGATELAYVTWAFAQGFDCLFRVGLQPDELKTRVTALIEDFDRLPADGFWDLPVSDFPVLARHQVPPLFDLAAVGDRDATDYLRLAGKYERLQLPSLHTGGWFDIFTQATLDSFAAMRASGHETRLIMGPWTHTHFLDPVGERPFGVLSAREAPAHPHGDWAGEVLAFLGRHLGADDWAGDGGPPVRLFVMGRNEWRDEEEWPLARAQAQRWYLHADCRLSADAPEDAVEPSVVQYDPANPVPFHGGANITPFAVAGPVDQARIEARDDVLIFTSAVLPEELEVTGRIRAVLHVESSAPSTDWVARLCDVTPDGRSFNLCDGIVRVASGADKLQKVEIDLWSTSNVFLAGHRIRVQITNTCFPRWDRNLNTGSQSEARFVTAHQRLHHDAQHPSYIELPVVRD